MQKGKDEGVRKAFQALRISREMGNVERAIEHSSGRHNNDAEHTFACINLAYELKDYLDVDITKVIFMLLVHDRVELVCSDTAIYNKTKNTKESELAAANIVFKDDPNSKELWMEFFECKTPEARVANEIDWVEGMYMALSNPKTFEGLSAIQKERYEMYSRDTLRQFREGILKKVYTKIKADVAVLISKGSE